jgi:hypothetical protein
MFFMSVEILGIVWTAAEQQTVSQLLVTMSAVHFCCLHRLSQEAGGLCHVVEASRSHLMQKKFVTQQGWTDDVPRRTCDSRPIILAVTAPMCRVRISYVCV